MKKTLLSLALIATSFTFSQVLQSENFDALTLGNVGTDVTGVTTGQGGYYTANGTNASYQIVSETTGKSLQITGSNTATGSRFMWKDGLVSAWAGRTSGNEVINIEFDLFTIAWIGYMASANGRFFEGGYSGISETKIGTSRNYIKESISNIQKQISSIRDINFVCCSYENLDIPQNSIIYCDIPYKNTKQYSFSKDFNYEKFWEWAREKSQNGYKVFISEYNAPDDFECIWQQEVKSSLSANGIAGGNKVSVEKLFAYRG